MNIILLSGGSGKRLWPLSNEIRSKQFLRLFRNDETGEHESMVQRVYRQIRTADPSAQVTVATSKSQVSSIRNQLGEEVGISVEPARRDTFPAIALSCAYLRDVRHVPEDEPVVICPVDPYVELSYFKALSDMSRIVSETDSLKLLLMGIEPTYPSEKYGYIIPETADPVCRVREFREKPDLETAKEFLKQNALWNGGVFAFRLGYVLEKTKEQYPFIDYYDLYSHYDLLEKTSFDYAVVEKEKDILALRYDGEWKDLGTWNTLTEAMDESIVGSGVLGGGCENVNIINELDMPILCMGLKNAIVSASVDGILVSDKEQSSYIKPYVDQFHSEVRFAEKSWGSFNVIDVQDESLTIRVVLHKGHRMNYHSHDHRDEVWTITEGTGRTIVDGMEQRVRPGDVICMQAGCRHTIIADTELKLIEVQLGRDISVSDKHKYDMPEA
ncbi:MAG: cupin domain-containing protein [Lachnospiraceae bacterium]|nr:cupin domain-containing protein [Lachnospiraceae bacterium]